MRLLAGGQGRCALPRVVGRAVAPVAKVAAKGSMGSMRRRRVAVPVAPMTVASGPASGVTRTSLGALVTGSLHPAASRRRFAARTVGTNFAVLPP